MTDDINADALMVRALLSMSKVTFCLDTGIFVSAGCMKKMGFAAFDKHYLYVFENTFFFISNIGITKAWKRSSQMKTPESLRNLAFLNSIKPLWQLCPSVLCR